MIIDSAWRMNGWVCCEEYEKGLQAKRPDIADPLGLHCGCPINGPKNYHHEYGWRVRLSLRRRNGRLILRIVREI